MPSSQDFEHLLTRRNVVAVAYDEDSDTVRTWVTRKRPLSELDEQDVVAEGVPDDGPDTDVEEASLDDDAEGFTPELLNPDNPPMEIFSNRHTRHRPIQAGISEIHSSSTAATSGPYPAKIVDTSKGNWASIASEGDLVRLSNCHSYALSGQAELGDTLLQPSPYDGGNSDDTSGGLLGYLPLEDGVRADVAARTVDRETDTEKSHNVDEEWPTAIRRERPETGETLTKTGRTTGVTEGRVEAVGASVRVSYPHETVTLRDQILTSDMSQGGDSGSPVYDTDGALVGLLFAGSSRVTVHNHIANVESDFGVQLMTEEPESDTSERTFEDYLEELLVDEYGEDSVFRQYYLSTGRIADFVVVDAAHDQLLCFELENDAGSMIGGAGQCAYYAANATIDLGNEGSNLYADVAPLVDMPENLTTQAVLCFPQDHINDDERPIYDQMGLRLREEEVPDDVSLEGV